MSLFRETNEEDAKLSMTRFVMFAFVVLAFIAVIMGRDAETVKAIIEGAFGATAAKVFEVVKKITGGKESAPTT